MFNFCSLFKVFKFVCILFFLFALGPLEKKIKMSPLWHALPWAGVEFARMCGIKSLSDSLFLFYIFVTCSPLTFPPLAPLGLAGVSSWTRTRFKLVPETAQLRRPTCGECRFLRGNFWLLELRAGPLLVLLLVSV